MHEAEKNLRDAVDALNAAQKAYRLAKDRGENVPLLAFQWPTRDDGSDGCSIGLLRLRLVTFAR